MGKEGVDFLNCFFHVLFFARFYIQEHFRVGNFPGHLKNGISVWGNHMSKQLRRSGSVKNEQIYLIFEFLMNVLELLHIVRG